ncbi:NAD(P)-dependent dehydrogenase (short-subunit alcohol dehydrogenase family) [Rhodoligotrophos appendicifer]|uniref:SDR family NAD(P)-dependent oxidoreductase n=1 Tax=Rhodoligotrophos appendicifer TaxID=987056 RepID=UPI001184BA45|nr:SDR family NAD(P)-dependent oxidoreductase [Rhodoligotrophos appendicifer]
MTEKQLAIVTGGAGGIGFATAARLTARNVDVLIVDRDSDALETAGRKLAGGPGEIMTQLVDVTRPADVTACVDAVLAKFGRIDILVNIAGGAGPRKAYQIDDIDIDVWDHVIELNLKSTFLFCRAVMPTMRERNYGRIVNLSSVIAYGEKGVPTTVTARLPYATAKAALIGFTAQLAKDVAAHGITVNTLSPGLILGDPGTRIRDRFDTLPETERARMLAAYPIARPGSPDEVAAAIEFLVSEAASYVSGVDLPIDGAYS